MAINFIVNDPQVTDPGLRNEDPRPDRPVDRAGFNYVNQTPEGEHPPGTPEFLFWQCRQAALAAVDAWENVDGPLSSWSQFLNLDLLQDSGEDLNAYYNRRSLSFFHQTVGDQTYFSGASTDVVAHEAGHGLLDVIRPDFWASFFFEVNAFHEGFGDVIAVLTALADGESRERLLDRFPDLSQPNFVEATAEDLAQGISRAFPGHNAGEPRHCLNDFLWQRPTSLPNTGGPGELIGEIHSFGQIITGCIYDTLRNIFLNMTSQDPHSLWTATETVARLFFEATRNAVQSTRFFRSVGNEMLDADLRQEGGANQDAILDAFRTHGIDLDAVKMTIPSAILTTEAPALAAVAGLPEPTRRELSALIGGETTAPPVTRARSFSGMNVVEVLNTRMVRLDDVHEKLQGVVAPAIESVWLGDDHGRTAVMGPFPQAAATRNDVIAFVTSLWQHGNLALEGIKAENPEALPTHEVQEEDGRQVLRRIRFACKAGFRHP